ncbi:phage tail protein [Pseudomonas sp. NPDC090202]|uniref:phage tail protein n=1 Tax=unclassified Pseudomonas TaxID=196821 RepID=UPI00381B03FC
MEVFLGTIQGFGFNFAPSGWALCNGQIIAIAQNNALFALLGTFYGGNGVSNFALPNLQSRMPIGQGTGPGLSTRTIGEVSGTEQVSVMVSNLPQLPINTATLAVNTTIKLASTPSNPVTAPTSTNAYLGASSGGPGSANIYSNAQGSEPVNLLGTQSTLTGNLSIPGGNQPLQTMNPYLAINFSVALSGIYPSRN